MQSDVQLLREYGQQANEAAFREIVARHAALVYSSALRQVESPDLARDVAQNVFSDLARKARAVAANMNPNSSLVGWLYRATRFDALALRRSMSRQRSRERQAMENLLSNPECDADWERLRPDLDEAMADLSDLDRDAVLLRFFKNQDLREVGIALGISDDAAQKRVSRALEKLRESLSRRGITTASGALAVAITANAVQSAPATLALALATAALAGTALQTSTAIATTKAIAMTTLQKTIVGAALAAAIGTGIFEARQALLVRRENQTLAEQLEQITQERDAALSNAATRDSQLAALQDDKSELMRLRAEIGALRRQTNELDQLRREAQRQARLAAPGRSSPPPDADPESEAHRQMAIAKMNDAKLLGLGLLMYASEHQERYPSDLSQASNYWQEAQTRLTGTNQFESLAQGSVRSITNPAATIVLREKEAMLVAGKFVKTYGFADGHAEVKVEPPEGFDAWEKQHMMPGL